MPVLWGQLATATTCNLTTLAIVIATVVSTSHVFAYDFSGVVYHRCYDGDTCTFTIPDVHPLLGARINVQLAGIDTPEIRGRCKQEKDLALHVRDLVRDKLAHAHHIELQNVQRGKYFRLVAHVIVDGEDLSAWLLEQNLAIPYDGGTKTNPWCPHE